MSTVECPYCKHEQEVIQDDGHATTDGQIYEQLCESCDKCFAMVPSLSYDFSSHKADCMNGSPHNWTVSERSLFQGKRRRHCNDCDAAEWFEVTP